MIYSKDENPEYDAFVEKFKPKKTTDDCYTPQIVYDAILTWAISRFDLGSRPIIRPFYPGGDYTRFDYPDACAIVDNPPFSILSEICAWYDARKIAYFLFAPTLTLFSINSGRCKYYISGADVTYENGAKVNTSFVTNLGAGKIVIDSALNRAIRAADEKNRAGKAKHIPKYTYPDCVVTAALLQKVSDRDVSMEIGEGECVFVRGLDAQKAQGKSCFGGGRFCCRLRRQQRRRQQRRRQLRRRQLRRRQLAFGSCRRENDKSLQTSEKNKRTRRSNFFENSFSRDIPGYLRRRCS